MNKLENKKKELQEKKINLDDEFLKGYLLDYENDDFEEAKSHFEKIDFTNCQDSKTLSFMANVIVSDEVAFELDEMAHEMLKKSLLLDPENTDALLQIYLLHQYHSIKSNKKDTREYFERYYMLTNDYDDDREAYLYECDSFECFENRIKIKKLEKEVKNLKEKLNFRRGTQ